MKAKTDKRGVRFILLHIFLGFTSLAFSQTPTIPSAGSKTGWTYYALLSPAVRGVPGEKWVDLNFSAIGRDSISKKPATGIRLKSVETMNVRNAPLLAKPGGGYEWPPIVGILGIGATVTVLDVREYPLNEGIHYWIKIQRD